RRNEVTIAIVIVQEAIPFWPAAHDPLHTFLFAKHCLLKLCKDRVVFQCLIHVCPWWGLAPNFLKLFSKWHRVRSPRAGSSEGPMAWRRERPTASSRSIAILALFVIYCVHGKL